MDNKRKKGSSVERVLQIVETVAQSPYPLSPGDLSNLLDIPKPSVHRLLQQLQQTGFLQLDLQGKVICGQRTHQLALGLWQTSRYKMERKAVLEHLATEIGETVGIAVLHELDIVYVDRVISNWPLQIYLPEGTKVPVWASASGKVLLAQLPPEQCRRIVDNLSIHALTTNTLTNKEQFMQAIDLARASQLGIDNEEFIPGMVACAVPVPNGGQPSYATVFTHGPTLRNSLSEIVKYAPLLRTAADKLADIFKNQTS